MDKKIPPRPIINYDGTPHVPTVPPDHQLAPKKRHLWKWLKFKHSNLTKKQKILVSILLVVLVVGGSAATYWAYKHFHKSPASSSSKAHKATPTTVASPLTGVQVSPELAKRPVTGIMIENSPDSRPQSGLQAAGVVYEAIAEGGITRFLALYQEARPDYVGPVRSVRPYYLDWLLPFDASIAHVGGAPQALADIKTLGVRDLDQFANSGAYQRVSNRYAPHNVYTNFDKIDVLNAAKGYTTSTFTGWPRKKDQPPKPPTVPNARVIDVNISNSAFYSSHYDYDAATDSYKRGEGGVAHIDERSGAQLNPKVVIVMVMGRGIAGDGQHTEYATSGSGKVYVFQDGTVKEGTWNKADRKSQVSFKDAAGAIIKLNAGQTWLTAVDNPGAVSFGP